MKPLIAALCLCGLPAFAAETISLEVQLDPAALAKLQVLNEGVVISGWFSGEPVAGNTVPLDEMGLVWLGKEELTIWPQASAKVTLGSGLSAAPVASVVAPMLNVNVFTARFADEDNLLDCSLVEGPLAELAKSPQVITCKLIGG